MPKKRSNSPDYSTQIRSFFFSGTKERKSPPREISPVDQQPVFPIINERPINMRRTILAEFYNSLTASIDQTKTIMTAHLERKSIVPETSSAKQLLELLIKEIVDYGITKKNVEGFVAQALPDIMFNIYCCLIAMEKYQARLLEAIHQNANIQTDQDTIIQLKIKLDESIILSQQLKSLHSAYWQMEKQEEVSSANGSPRSTSSSNELSYSSSDDEKSISEDKNSSNDESQDNMGWLKVKTHSQDNGFNNQPRTRKLIGNKHKNTNSDLFQPSADNLEKYYSMHGPNDYSSYLALKQEREQTYGAFLNARIDNTIEIKQPHSPKMR